MKVKGSYEVYKPNTDFNPNVEELIRICKYAKDPEDYIAYLSGAKETIQTEERIMQKLKSIRKVINQGLENETI